jgi:site-specific recombinase XerD
MTFATIALNSGINIRIIQAVLGHNRIRTTEIYAKLAT